MTSAPLACGLPPGWIELVAFETDEQLRGFLEDQLAVDPLDDEQRGQVIAACLRARSIAAPQGWLHLGAVVTYLPDAEAGGTTRVTVWVIGLGLLVVPELGDLNPTAVTERALARVARLGLVGAVDVVEPFTLDDGRDGVVFGGRTEPDQRLLTAQAGHPVAPGPLGVYGVLLPVSGLPGHLALTLGVAPTVEERQAMSFLAGQMASSLHLVGDPDSYPRHQVLIDRTGTLQPRGYLEAEPEAVPGG